MLDNDLTMRPVALSDCRRAVAVDFRALAASLADNAVTFTEAGEIAALRTDPLRPGALVCAVRDTWSGLRSGPAEALFEGFAQRDSSATRAVGGMGLGLARCRRGAQRLGGWIEAESAPGRGATFRVVIPDAFDPAAAAPPLPTVALSA